MSSAMSSLCVSDLMLISCLILGILIGKFWHMKAYFGGKSCMKKMTYRCQLDISKISIYILLQFIQPSASLSVTSGPVGSETCQPIPHIPEAEAQVSARWAVVRRTWCRLPRC